MSNKSKHMPLVTIGVPVRNGEGFIREALDLLVQQTYPNVEIIISDNKSTDNTAQICKEYAEAHSSISYILQEDNLTALENFKFLITQGKGELFMWAAADDRRDLNYIEALVQAFEHNHTASVAFGHLAVFSDIENWKAAERKPCPIAFRENESAYAQLISSSYKQSGYAHMYGLMRKSYLQEFDWKAIEVGPDESCLYYLARRGPFVETQQTCFYQRKPPKAKTAKQRAKNESLTNLKPFLNFRRAVLCAEAGKAAEQAKGKNFISCIAIPCFLIGRVITVVKKRIKRHG